MCWQDEVAFFKNGSASCGYSFAIILDVVSPPKNNILTFSCQFKGGCSILGSRPKLFINCLCVFARRTNKWRSVQSAPPSHQSECSRICKQMTNIWLFIHGLEIPLADEYHWKIFSWFSPNFFYYLFYTWQNIKLSSSGPLKWCALMLHALIFLSGWERISHFTIPQITMKCKRHFVHELGSKHKLSNNIKHSCRLDKMSNNFPKLTQNVILGRRLQIW